ncbi:ribonuclease H-like domain-containing protein, partial [Amanita rubescens]
REAMHELHTGQWIRNAVNTVVKEIGPTRFAAIVCDSTGNTRLSRELLENDLPVAFNVPDICHHIGNTIKNIMNISYFRKVILIVRGVISKFHKSHIGAAELNLARKEAGIKHGLEAISKTRFGTMVRAARSLNRCLPAIKKVVERGAFSLGPDLAKYFPSKTNYTSSEFEIILRQLIDIGWPTLKVLTCLEANQATPGDICVYWHALLYEVNSVLCDPERTIPNDAVHEIYSILNLRHNELFGDGRISSAAELYYVGAYLDPS